MSNVIIPKNSCYWEFWRKHFHQQTNKNHRTGNENHHQLNSNYKQKLSNV